MDTYFSEDVLTGMRCAEDKARRKKNRLRIKVGEEIYPVLRSFKTFNHLQSLLSVCYHFQPNFNSF